MQTIVLSYISPPIINSPFFPNQFLIYVQDWFCSTNYYSLFTRFFTTASRYNLSTTKIRSHLASYKALDAYFDDRHWYFFTPSLTYIQLTESTSFLVISSLLHLQCRKHDGTRGDWWRSLRWPVSTASLLITHCSRRQIRCQRSRRSCDAGIYTSAGRACLIRGDSSAIYWFSAWRSFYKRSH